jgi:F-type H+-transporting ATPase subunit a
MVCRIAGVGLGFARGGVLAIRLGLLVVLLVLVPSLARAESKKTNPSTSEPGQKASAEKGPGHPDTQEHKPNPIEHVKDSETWELFSSLQGRKVWGIPLDKWHLPKIEYQGKLVFQFTKFMILELVAACLILIIYIPLSRRLRSGEPARGAWDNLFETFLGFIREQIAKPNLGEHDADRFVPFLWTMFLFILFNNLLGMVPLGGSPTASMSVTLGLAICVFFAIHGSAVAKMGFGHYLESLWPHLDVPFLMGLVIKPLVFVIELIGVIVRNAVLAVRLFANMFAGHTVLATILIFIKLTAKSPVLWAAVTVSSVLGMVALSLLELFIAFLQAYIFTFLSSLFIGMAIHPEH